MSHISEKELPVALAHCPSYEHSQLARALGDVLDAGGPRITPGLRVLVKPNMVSSKPLSCTTPAVVAGVCAWLLDRGARLTVAESPGIGRATTIARTIGLEDALRPLGVRVQNMNRPVQVELPLGAQAQARCGGPVRVGVSRLALESELIVSVARLKAHRFTLLTMAVKNCFGCVPGVRKALMHMHHGRETDFFADCLAALWAVLPPVAGVIDGIEAMHETGPISGRPVSLGLLGASPSAVALDASVATALGVTDESRLPLAAALRRRGAMDGMDDGEHVVWPLCRPQDFDCSAFILPGQLDSAWFHPLRILKSARARLSAFFRS